MAKYDKYCQVFKRGEKSGHEPPKGAPRQIGETDDQLKSG
jgi:hypothetical protein